MRRELEEELGIDRNEKIDIYDIELIEMKCKNDIKMQIKIYCMFTDYEENEFILQKEEVESVSYEDLDKVYELVKTKQTRFPNDEKVLKIIENVNKIIKNRQLIKNENIRGE